MNTQRYLMVEQCHLAMACLWVSGRQSDVARELGVSQSVISRLASRHRTTGRVHDRPRSGPPQVTDRNDDQYLRTYALRHRYATSTQLQAHLRDVNPLTPRHSRESTRPCDLDNAAVVSPCSGSLSTEMMIISVAGEGDHTPNFLFMDDNAPPRHARIVTAQLQEVEVPYMVWPAMSPDLNPIEQVRNQLKQRLDDRTPPPRDLAELCVALVEEWNVLPQNNIMRLVRSMRRRCQAVIAANGGNTRY
ncbi:hypothetical protein QQF64_014626 [Cirrhinus molitorella]|uniref:Tc1-like transposase DDE domain-containing protein n=1 Tax=Cirrhinus molitorella TaxID=172907 RepID=A0ABR3NTU8_9TELE